MQQTVYELIKNYVSIYPDRMNSQSRWQEPLVGFVAADDERLPMLKERVSPTHAMPQDFLADACTVIVYFIPFAKNTVLSNQQGRTASREWAVAYIETNKLILDLNTHLKERFRQGGYNSAVIPATHNFDEKTLLSDWSHRHLAYFAGLGNFGLNNMLITEKGCCGRLGSMVTNMPVMPSSRSEKENCLFKHSGLCKKCVSHCVNEALSAKSFNRHKCYEMCLRNAETFAAIGLADVCGKCLVNVPCSFSSPTEKLG